MLTAIQLAAGRLGKTHAASKAAVYANVNIGDAKEYGDYGLSVDIQIEGVEDQEVIDAGHKVRRHHDTSLTHACSSLAALSI